MTDAIDFLNSQAILLGTARYEDPRLPDMPAAANSLRAMHELLTGPRCGWPKSRVTSLQDMTRRDDVGPKIANLIHDTTDVLLFYYVGHGQLLEGEQLGMALADTEQAPRRRWSTSLRLNDLRHEIRYSPARIKLLILDCCYSGLATKNTQSVGIAIADRVELVAKVAGAYTLTASLASQVARYEEGPGGLTYFTRFFTDVVRDGVPGKNARLSLKEIHDEVAARFRRLELPDGEPPPEPSKLTTDGADELLFSVNHAFTLPIPLPAAAPPAVVSTGRERPTNALLGELRYSARKRCDIQRLASELVPMRWRLRAETELESPADGGVDGIAAFYLRPDATGRLVVLGGAGSGKTTLVERLVETLLSREGQDHPLPICLPAADWNPCDRGLRDWVVDDLLSDLPARRGIDPGEARSLMEIEFDTGRILPVLDGLDELPSSERKEAITQLNYTYATTKVILTCRTEDFPQPATTGLQHADVVELQPLDIADVGPYLRRTTPAVWDNVLTHLRADPDKALAQVLRKPVMMRLAGNLYSTRLPSGYRFPDELMSLPGQAEMENHLLTAVATSAYPSHDPGCPWSAVDTHRWLGFLRDHAGRSTRFAHNHGIAWWELSRAVPVWLFGPAVGLLAAIALFAPGIVTVTLGTVPSLQVSFWELVGGGLLLGGLLGFVAGAAWSTGPLLHPVSHPLRRLDIGLSLGITTAGAIATPVLASVLPGMIAGLAVLGVVIGTFVAAHLLLSGRWAPSQQRFFGLATEARRPQSLLRTDRTFSWWLSGLVFWWSAVSYFVGGLKDGKWIIGLPGDIWFAVVLLLCVLLYGSATFRFTITRACLTATGNLPWQLMRFLDDAHRRQVLRRVGGTYEFRYSHPVSRPATPPGMTQPSAAS